MRYFKAEEFRCKCGCGKTDMDPTVIARLDELRGMFGKAVVITSGYRCPDHNARVGGKQNSAHLFGKAADIAVFNSSDRFRLLQLAFACGFRRIGVASGFLHYDLDAEQPQNVCWTY